MQLRAEGLQAHLNKGLARIYTVHGDEPLLAQEAADQIRAAARAQGFGERQIFTVAGAYFDWAPVLAAAQAMSLFAERQFIEIRIPTGKPGKDGSEALQRYAEAAPDDVLTLVTLPRLDKTQLGSAWFTALDGHGVSLRVEPVERRALPAWLAQRLKSQGQSVPEGEDGQKALAFFADRVEGNLLAAHQELQKLALLHPRGELTLEQIEAAVLDVARFDVFKLSEAVLSGAVPRLLRMLDGLEAEGEAAVLVHWTLAEDARALARVRAALDAGKPLPLALREARVWGAKERLVERIAPRLDAERAGALVQAAQVCDGLVKGLRHPDWPSDPWAALRRLALMLAEAASGKAGAVLTAR
jgi:DNA polymerase-3 subunit delta